MRYPSDLLSAFLDGELAPEARVAVSTHLGECPPCEADLDGLARVRDWIRGLPVEESLVPLVPASSRSRLWIRAAAAAAAAVFAIGLVASPTKPEVLDLDVLAGQHTVRVGLTPGLSMIRGQVGGP